MPALLLGLAVALGFARGLSKRLPAEPDVSAGSPPPAAMTPLPTNVRVLDAHRHPTR